MEKTQKTVWQTLSEIDCREQIEKKNGLSYLSWAWAWGIVKAYYPDANYSVVHYDNKPYLCDDNLGYMVATQVTINGETIPMQLPVMDGANKAMKSKPSTYQVAERSGGRKTGKMIDKSVNAATMFDINTAIMRCLTKNLAMFGLGHYIYAGEDVPGELKPSAESEELLGQIKELRSLKIDSIPKDKMLIIDNIINKCDSKKYNQAINYLQKL